MYGLLDQLRYDNVLRLLYENGPEDHFDFRYLVANSLRENIDNGHIYWDAQELVYLFKYFLKFLITS